MQLYELEVSNYKCLDSKEMPLRFDSLNVLIGENDSGKTSLLEVIEIILKQREIKKSMFFNPDKVIRINAKFNNVQKEIIQEACQLQQLKISFNEYLETINKGWDHYTYREQIKILPFNESINLLRNYSFYNDLKSFYKNYIQSAIITGKLVFEINKDKKSSYNEIDSDSIAYLDFEYKPEKFLEKLLNNNEFIKFMNGSLNKFDNRCLQIFSDFFDSQIPPRFIDDYNFLFDFTDFSLKDIGSPMFKFLRRLYAQKVFSDDSTEIIILKIAKILSGIINTKNKPDTWECDFSLQIGGYWKEGLDRFTLKYDNNPICCSEEMKSYEMKNIFSNYVDKINSFSFKDISFLPTLKVFRTEVVNKEIPYKLFEDLYGGLGRLEDYIYEETREFFKKLSGRINTEYLDNLLNKENLSLIDIKNKLIEYMKVLGEEVKDIDIEFKIKELEDTFFDFQGYTNLDKIKFNELIKSNIIITLKEGDKNIDLAQKSQGFLRKMLITDFLMLLDEDNSKTNDNKLSSAGKIILVEEPELHLHCNAQRMIMEIIKENLSKIYNQVFITTHSHYIIKGTDISDFYIFKKDKGNGISSIDNIKQQWDVDTKILHKLENSLGLEPIDMLSFKKLIVLVEGKHDIAFIKGLCNHPKVKVNPEEILFKEAEGQSNIDYFIGLGATLKIKILIILDNNKRNLKKKKEILDESDYKNKEVLNSILCVNVLREADILNYLDLEQVEKHFNKKIGSLRPKNLKDLVKDIINEKVGYIECEDIEFFAKQLKDIDDDLMKKIIEPIKLLFKVF